MHLSSNRSQMTSKCFKNKKVAHEAIAECVTDVLTSVRDVLHVITVGNFVLHSAAEFLCERKSSIF